MPGMKRDCGGAAGVLGAFRSAVKLVSVSFAENTCSMLTLETPAKGVKYVQS